MNIPVIIVALISLGYGFYLRNLVQFWKFYPGTWAAQARGFLLSPVVKYTAEDGIEHKLTVSVFSGYRREPLKLLINKDHNKAHMVGVENVFIGMGIFLLIIQFLSLFI